MLSNAFTLRHASWAFASTLFLVVGCNGGGGGGGGRPPSNLQYSQPSSTYDLCGAIDPNTPSSGGSAVTSYAISPALPAGLSFDTNTGVISGSPSAVAAQTTYTVTATNAYGQTTTDVTIEVAHELPAGLTYPDLGAELGLGVYVEVTPALSAGYGSSWSVSAGALPSGLSIDPATGVISGVPSALGSSSFSVTVLDCAAASTFDAFAADVVPPYARGVCVVDGATGVARMLSRSAATGALAHRDQEWAGTNLDVVVVHPWSHLAFAARGGVIHTLSIVSRTLALDSTVHSVSTGAAALTDLACSHDGRFLYATSSLGVLYSFAIDTADGELTPTPTASVATGSSPDSIVIDSTDSWLFVANEGDDTIGAYSIDGLDGDLTALGATASGDGVRVLALTSDDARLYAGCSSASAIHGYDVNALTGALTPQAWSPAAIGTNGVSAMALTTDDAHLYLGLDAATSILAFDLNAGTGEPTGSAFANVDGLDATRQLVMEPRGAHLYSAHEGGQIQAWSVAGSGQLSAATIAVANGGSEASEIALVLGHGEWSPSTRSVYATSLAADGVYEYAFDSGTGAITAITGSPLSTGINPQTIAVHPFFERAVVAHQSPGSLQALTVHRIQTDGELGGGSGYGSSTGNVGFEFQRSGDFGYLVRSTGSGAVLTSYAFDGASGLLDSLGSVSFSATPWPPAAHPSGALLVVPDSGPDQLDVFDLDPETGVATSAGSVATGGLNPFRAVFDASGRFAFVAHLGSDQISVFQVDLSTNTLSAIAGSPFATGVTPLVMGVSSSGAALMIADTAQGQWEYYTIDQDPTSPAVDGSLTLAGSGSQAGMALLRFDARDEYLIWVHSGTNRIRTSPITAPGTLGAVISDLAIGAQITSLGQRHR